MAPIFTGGRMGFGRVDAPSGTAVGLSPISATGGTKTTGSGPASGYTIHTFTSPGSFTVSSGSNNIQYLVVAGGGGGVQAEGNQNAGGAGGGGFRTNVPGHPLAGSALLVGPGSYSIQVGSGGPNFHWTSLPSGPSYNGQPSFIGSLITSDGGGASNTAGGSGGGGFAGPTPGAAGNTPPVSPPQGNPGGEGIPYNNSSGSGGGGAGGAGQPASGPGAGGPGSTIDITGSSGTYSAGGNGSQRGNAPTPANSGNGGPSNYSGAGTSGAPGIVIIRYLS